MTGFNMPPGCSPSDIPGNRPEDMEFEAAEEAAIEEMAKICKTPADYQLVLDTLKANLPLVQAAVKRACEDMAFGWEAERAAKQPIISAALKWADYQEHDSLEDQKTDAKLRAAAAKARVDLLEAIDEFKGF